MKNNRKGLFTAFFLFTVLSIACKKEPQHIPVNATIKKYFGYMPGTYWIYVDSMTGIEDSFAVTDKTYTSEKDNNGLSHEREMTLVRQYHQGKELKTCYWDFSTGANVVFDYPNHYIDILYPYLRDTIQYFPDSIASISTNIQGLIIRGITYDSVHEINRTSRSVMHSFRDRFFINKSAGMVKMAFTDPDSTTGYVYELVRWKIVR